MNETSGDRKKQIIAGLAVLLLIVVIVAGVSLSSKKDDSATNTATTTTSASSTATYKDGTYTATGGYNSPGGSETITISVTLKDGVVTDTAAIPGYDNPDSKENQTNFIAAYKEEIVGKKLSSLNLSRVAGASLTTEGFNNAIQKIESEAEA